MLMLHILGNMAHCNMLSRGWQWDLDAPGTDLTTEMQLCNMAHDNMASVVVLACGDRV